MIKKNVIINNVIKNNVIKNNLFPLVTGLFIVSVILLVLLSNKSIIEGYTNILAWPDDLIKRFIAYQTTVNRGSNQFDLAILQQQASPEEAETLLETGYWPWPDDLKYDYMDKVWSNPILKIDPAVSLDYTMKIYNQNAATKLMSWNTKEGEFLLYGGKTGDKGSIMCSDDSVMKKTVTNGYNLWNGFPYTSTTTIENADIPQQMPGFSFVNGPCNPCVALEDDYSCPFKLNIKGDDTVTPIWKKLWNI